MAKRGMLDSVLMTTDDGPSSSEAVPLARVDEGLQPPGVVVTGPEESVRLLPTSAPATPEGTRTVLPAETVSPRDSRRQFGSPSLRTMASRASLSEWQDLVSREERLLDDLAACAAERAMLELHLKLAGHDLGLAREQPRSQ